MPFITSELIKGRIFVPEKRPCLQQKHPCKDCFACQQCSDERCTLCICEKKDDSWKRPGEECVGD